MSDILEAIATDHREKREAAEARVVELEKVLELLLDSSNTSRPVFEREARSALEKGDD